MSEYSQEQTTDEANISWTASEFVEHQKDTSWYVGLGAIAAVVAVVVFFISGQDLIAVFSVVAAVIILGVFASRKPDDKVFTITNEGVYVGEELYPYNNFESFSVIHDGNFESIYLVPNKRFATPLNLYFPPEQGDEIVDMIGRNVSYGDKDISFVERMMHQLKF